MPTGIFNNPIDRAKKISNTLKNRGIKPSKICIQKGAEASREFIINYNKKRIGNTYALNKGGNYHLTKYNITKETYDILSNSQNNVCAICKKPNNIKNGKIKKLGVDHCHKTGRIRGLLCTKCNIGIGMLDDNVNFLESAIKYLLRN